MIAHFSIPSKKPKETASFFAAVIDGLVFDFGGVVAGAWIAVAKDRSGVAVEVYPNDMAHHPGAGEVDPTAKAEGPTAMPWEDQIHRDHVQTRPSGFHVAMGTKRTEAEIVDLAKAAGWRAIACERAGVFGVVEVWVDNTFLVEVLVPAEVDRYRKFMNPEGCGEMFGPSIAPARS
jgi:hypothetical protein